MRFFSLHYLSVNFDNIFSSARFYTFFCCHITFFFSGKIFIAVPKSVYFGKKLSERGFRQKKKKENNNFFLKSKEKDEFRSFIQLILGIFTLSSD